MSSERDSSRIVVVDLGATVVRVGLAADRQPLMAFSTPAFRREIEETLVSAISSVLAANSPCSAVIVGCPGLVDRSGTIQKALYIDLAGLELARRLTAALGLVVRVTNDANLQAFGLLGQYTDALFLSLGTGIGGAVIANGRVVQGRRGFAGEIGHLEMAGHVGECRCGKTGCLDTIASGIALERLLGPTWWRKPQSRQVAGALRAAGYAVGHAASEICTVLDPEAIVIAGHLAGNSEFVESVGGATKTGSVSAALRFVVDSWSLVALGAKHITLQEEI